MRDILGGAARAWESEELKSVFKSLQGPDGAGLLGDPANWQRMRVEVAEPLASGLEAADGDAEAVALAAAEALATRACAYVGCTTVAGATEAGMPRGSRCGNCSVMRYCCKACQKADWRVHKAVCGELAKRAPRGAGAN